MSTWIRNEKIAVQRYLGAGMWLPTMGKPYKVKLSDITKSPNQAQDFIGTMYDVERGDYFFVYTLKQMRHRMLVALLNDYESIDPKVFADMIGVPVSFIKTLQKYGKRSSEMYDSDHYEITKNIIAQLLAGSGLGRGVQWDEWKDPTAFVISGETPWKGDPDGWIYYEKWFNSDPDNKKTTIKMELDGIEKLGNIIGFATTLGMYRVNNKYYFVDII